MLLYIRPYIKTLGVLFSRIGCQNAVHQKRGVAKLLEVGIFVPPKPTTGTYETGQLFFHRVFGYRGVVLFPWTARVYDRDASSARKKNEPTIGEDRTIPENREAKTRAETYYQVLIDSRDSPHIRAQSEAVTFLGSRDGNKAIYVVPGLDYVSHADILPYNSKDKKAIHHELFDKFLHYDSAKTPAFFGRESLKAWQKKNSSFLDNSEVHIETTENIRVTVMPFFMGVREGEPATQYWWRYCVRLENLAQPSVQLRERLWRLFSLSGTLETVRGRGVVGKEPVLSRARPAFQYSSHVSLQSPSGHMWGTFRMEREDGYTFDCRIPPFSLESNKNLY